MYVVFCIRQFTQTSLVPRQCSQLQVWARIPMNIKAPDDQQPTTAVQLHVRLRRFPSFYGRQLYNSVRVSEELAAASTRDEITWSPYESYRLLLGLFYFSSIILGGCFFCCPPRTAIPWYKSCHESFVPGQIGMIINYTRTLPTPEKTNKNAGKTKSQEKRSKSSSAIMLFYQV